MSYEIRVFAVYSNAKLLPELLLLLNSRLLFNSYNYYCCYDVCSNVIMTSWWLVSKYHLFAMLISGSQNIVAWFVFLVGNYFLSAFIIIKVDIVCLSWPVT